MNEARRKELNKAIDKVTAIKAAAEALVAQLQEVRAEVEQIKEAEEEAYDNLPESLQGGEREEDKDAVIEALEAFDSDMETLEDALGEPDFDDLISKLDDAKGVK